MVETWKWTKADKIHPQFETPIMESRSGDFWSPDYKRVNSVTRRWEARGGLAWFLAWIRYLDCCFLELWRRCCIRNLGACILGGGIAISAPRTQNGYRRILQIWMPK
ncbi:hypothetical protein SDJN03_10608, partial [Cucurbita argyrosperma subsp. sororia]